VGRPDTGFLVLELVLDGGNESCYVVQVVRCEKSMGAKSSSQVCILGIT
jgi:hypothetical protein